MLDKFIPRWARIALAVAAVLWLAFQLFDYGRTVERKTWEAKAANQATTTSEARRADEGATGQARSEASDDHIERIRTLSDQRDAAAAAAERLRKQLAAAQRVANGCAQSDPAAEQSRQAVAALGAVLAACEAEYRAMGRAAAEHYATGQLCEREYDALTVKASDTPDKGSGQ